MTGSLTSRFPALWAMAAALPALTFIPEPFGLVLGSHLSPFGLTPYLASSAGSAGELLAFLVGGVFGLGLLTISLLATALAGVLTGALTGDLESAARIWTSRAEICSR